VASIAALVLVLSLMITVPVAAKEPSSTARPRVVTLPNGTNRPACTRDSRAPPGPAPVDRHFMFPPCMGDGTLVRGQHCTTIPSFLETLPGTPDQERGGAAGLPALLGGNLWG
jgi:hypothetical protein